LTNTYQQTFHVNHYSHKKVEYKYKVFCYNAIVTSLSTSYIILNAILDEV